MDRRRHSITKYTKDEKTHTAINNKMLQRLGLINDQLFEVELAQSDIEQKETIILSFFYTEIR